MTVHEAAQEQDAPFVRNREPRDDEFCDLVYDRDALTTVREHFPHAELSDASDMIHEGRFAVILPMAERDDFYARMIVEGWARGCFGLELSLRLPEHHDNVRRWIAAAGALKAAS